MAWLCLLFALMSIFGGAPVASQTFTTNPIDILIRLGAVSTNPPITCAVQGFDPTTQVLSFAKDNIIISDDANRRDDVLTELGLTPDDYILTLTPGDPREFKLYVRNLAKNQAGKYKCIICGRTSDTKCDSSDIIVESGVGTLAVAYPPDPSTAQCSIQSDSGNTQVYLDETVTLTCSSGSAVPAVDLTWTKNGQSVSANISHGSTTSQAKIVLTAQNDDDGDVYACQLAYVGVSPDPDISDDCSLSALNVVSVPNVTIGLSEPVVLNEQAVFTCTVSSLTSSFSSGAIQWILPSDFDGGRTEESVSDKRSELTITKVEIGDHGKSFDCRVTDQDGISAMATKMLLISGLPEPTLPKTQVTTLEPPSTTAVPFPTAALVAGLFGGLLVLVLVGALITWYCMRHPPKWAAKKKQAGANSHIPMNNAGKFQAMPNKVPNHKIDQYSEGKDYPDEKMMNDPDVIPREKRGGDDPDGVDPRKWWRETMPPTDKVQYERSANNEYPTIKGMKMPFQDRSSPYMHMQDEDQHRNPSYNPVDDRDYAYRHHDDRNFSDSGSREPRYDDRGYTMYEGQQPNDHPYMGMKLGDRGSTDDYDYDNEAYDRSVNGQLDKERTDSYDQYNDQYNDRYDDQYDDQPVDRHEDQPYDRYDDRPVDGYDDRPDAGYNDRYDDRPDDQYSDQYGDRYESYGHPDGQEEYDMPPAENPDYYPNYDERIPDGHSSSNEHHSAPYDDREPYDDRGPSYNDHPSDPYGYDEQDYSGKHSYDDEDLRNTQDTPSYV